METLVNDVTKIAGPVAGTIAAILVAYVLPLVRKWFADRTSASAEARITQAIRDGVRGKMEAVRGLKKVNAWSSKSAQGIKQDVLEHIETMCAADIDTRARALGVTRDKYVSGVMLRIEAEVEDARPSWSVSTGELLSTLDDPGVSAARPTLSTVPPAPEAPAPVPVDSSSR